MVKKPRAATSGMPDANHRVGLRPSFCVTLDANGVTMNTPSQVVAANRPATVVETAAFLSIKSINGDSMKMPES
ncbi:hypothetical protein GALL_458190 [mine drainage metagenome]|uniref:Uncharacterized protein n=1 Tax=mine drainage metagenome TaxID=410659 RepID=A0A1J5PYB5_9ZZZZ